MMNKIAENNNRALNARYVLRYTLAFAVLSVMVYGILALEGKSLLWSVDGVEIEYAVFVYEGRWLRGIIKTLLATGSLIIPMWDTSIGMGSDSLIMMGTNPFTILSVFFPSQYAQLGMTVVTFIQAFLAGLSFSLFSIEHDKGKYPTLVGSMVYVFGGWMVTAALRQHFFMLPIILFPLLLLGADRVFRGKSPALLILSVALFLFSSVYFSYMAFIFLFGYCIHCYLKYVSNKGVISFVKWVLAIIGLMAIGFLISCAMSLPFINAILGEGRVSLERYVPLFYDLSYYPQFLSNFLTIGWVGMDAFIGFGGIALLACVLLLSQPGRRFVKISLVVLTLLALIPYFGHVLNGFAYVTNRWAWVYTFCISLVVVEMTPSFLHPTSRDKKVLVITAVALGLVVLLFPNTRTAAVFASCAIAFACVIAVLVRFHLGEPGAKSSAVAQRVFFALVALSVSYPAFNLMSDEGGNWAASEADVGKAYAAHTSNAPSHAIKKIKDSGVWRYDSAGISQARNNAMVQGLNSFDFYSSMYNNDVDMLFAGLRITASPMSNNMTGLDRRSMLDAVFGAKYFLVKQNSNLLPYGYGDEPVSTTKVAKKKYSVYESDVALPLAYLSKRMMSQDDYAALGPVEKQQALTQAVIVDDAALVNTEAENLDFTDEQLPYEVTDISKGIAVEDGTITVKSPGSITLEFMGLDKSETYLLIDELDYKGTPPSRAKNSSISDILDYAKEMYLWGEATEVAFTLKGSNKESVSYLCFTKKHHLYGGKDNKLFNMGYSENALSSITLEFKQAGVYTFDSMSVVCQPVDGLESALGGFRESPVQVEEGVNEYKVSVEAQDSGVIGTSIPWSSGWTAYLDGKQVDLAKVNTAFIGVAVDRGSHDVVFRYMSPYRVEGLYLSAMGLVAFILVIIARHVLMHKRKSYKRDNEVV